MKDTILPTPEFNSQQLTAARAKAWHQNAEPLLTLEATRDFVNEAGLVLFAPKPQLVAPAPSLIEATLGAANAAPTLAETQTAREMVARLAEDGSAVPLNLLGGPGDAPDFVASAQVFSYVFTMRGDKGWKQPPATSGAAKVSPLALGVYEALTANGSAMTAAELANELGREVTEAAISRALGELWVQLRVLPRLQLGDASTLWELTTQRYTRVVKEGANAGQPRALSALISLYLAQAITATEDEVEIFLSPLTARSRTKDVLHALAAAQQLEEIVLDGKTNLYVPGTLPEFEALPEPVVEAEGEAAEGAEAKPVERIRKFDAERKPRAFGRDERERRPFKRSADGETRPPRKTYDKPWDEDRKPRAEGDGDRPARPYRERKPFTPREGGATGGGERRPYERKPRAGGFGDRPSKPFSERKPYVKREGASSEGGERRPYERKPRAGGFGDRPSKPFGERKPYVKREGGSSEGGERRPYERKPRAEGFGAGRSERPFRERKPFAPREGGSSEGGERRPYTRKPFVPREGGGSGDRPSFDRKPRAGGFGDRGPKKFGGDRDRGEFKPRAPYKPRTPRTEGEGGGDRPSFDRKPRAGGFGDRSKFGGGGSKFGGKPKFGGPRAAGPKFGGDKPFRERKPFVKSEEGGAEARPFRKPAGKPFGKPGGKPFGKPAGKSFGKPGGKPFGKAGGGKFSKPGGKFTKPGGKTFGAKPARPKRRPEAEE